jgi:hypothetical protein
LTANVQGEYLPSFLYLHDIIDHVSVKVGKHVRQCFYYVLVFRTLYTPCLGIFSTRLACGGVLRIEYTGEFFLRGGTTPVGGVGAFVSGAPALFAAGAWRLIDVRGEARCHTGLGCCDGVKTILRSGSGVWLVGENAADGRERFLDSAQ